MAHLWMMSASGDWRIEPLEVDALQLTGGGVATRHDAGPARPCPAAIILVRASRETAGAASESWVLVADTTLDVRVNGIPLAGGMRVLTDRDEISLAGRRSYFSTERLALVTPFGGAGAAPICPRCQQGLEDGTPAVKCPSCDVWHHESTLLPCWTYADTCAICPHRTSLSAGYYWTPAGDRP